MKLSKPSEDTLKGLAKLLKDLRGKDAQIMIPGTSQINEALTKHISALDKDLRQLRKTISEMPEARELASEALGQMIQNQEAGNPCADIQMDGVRPKGEPIATGVVVGSSTMNMSPAIQAAVAGAEADGWVEKDLTVTGHLYVTGDVVFQAVPDTDLKEGDMMVKGDLFVTGDINLPAPQMGNLNGFQVAVYANPIQLDAGNMLLGVRKVEEGVFTEPLYRKQK